MTADEVRQAMAVDPEFVEFAEQMRERFGARLTWLKTPTVEIGKTLWRPNGGQKETLTAVASTAKDSSRSVMGSA